MPGGENRDAAGGSFLCENLVPKSERLVGNFSIEGAEAEQDAVFEFGKVVVVWGFDQGEDVAFPEEGDGGAEASDLTVRIFQGENHVPEIRRGLGHDVRAENLQ